MQHEVSGRSLRSAGRSVIVVAMTCSLPILLPAIGRAAPPLTVDQATAHCRETVGKPTVHACVQARKKAGGGPVEQLREACRASARPAVQACVAKMMPSTAGGRAADTAMSAVDVPKDLKSVATEKVGLVAPPRSANDVTEILDRQKPDPAQIEKLAAQAEAAPPADLKSQGLADFYFARAQAKERLGRREEAIADTDLAIQNAVGADYQNVVSRYEQFQLRLLRESGQARRVTEITNRQIAAFSKPGLKTGRGRLFGLYSGMIISRLRAGDTRGAEEFLARSKSLLAEARMWPSYSVYATSFGAPVEESVARVAEARGRLEEARAGYEKAAQLYSETIASLPKWPSHPPAEEFERRSDSMLAYAGRIKVKLGQTGEGEADIRRALLSRLNKVGKFHADTANLLGFFAFALQEQGRYADAEKIEREIIDIYKGLGYAEDSGQLVSAHLVLANLLSMQRRFDEAGLLRPVEQAWKPAKSLVIVTNGALGLLPLSLLPTSPAEITRDDDPLFSSYRQVPWLARTHAVSLMPSAAALITMRKLPAAGPGRSDLVGFGDPVFSPEDSEKASGELQTAVAGADNVTRGVPLRRRSSPQFEGVNTAELSMLPRLPDTADELKSIAEAMRADPGKALHLGKDANEQAVKSMDLSKVKVLAFATHGLVPGELDGLTQPALALTAPSIAGVAGDGLLTMEEILSLKLDADWVVLSACNTGAASGAGADAASGLGRAFFYAGSRALLVTNWSVHSESARELISGLFKRQAVDAKLTRSEALRQAMMALVDGPGYVGADGKTDFSYAHPLFWAPYSIIGDGG